MSIRKQIKSFLLVGFTATCLDFATYFLLVELGVERSLSKGISYVCGVYIGFLGNSIFTFEQRNSNLRRYLLVYLISLIANLTINYLSLMATQNGLIGWLAATLVSTFMNFAGLRYFAFSQKV
jgi:putative flippase GtrA